MATVVWEILLGLSASSMWEVTSIGMFFSLRSLKKIGALSSAMESHCLLQRIVLISFLHSWVRCPKVLHFLQVICLFPMFNASNLARSIKF